MYVEFDTRLQTLGSDYTVYLNSWSNSKPQSHETLVVFCIIRSLLTDPRSGVEVITVSPFKLRVVKSTAVEDAYVIDLIANAIAEAGFLAEQLTS